MDVMSMLPQTAAEKAQEMEDKQNTDDITKILPGVTIGEDTRTVESDGLQIPLDMSPDNQMAAIIERNRRIVNKATPFKKSQELR
jgi:hypothetical protein